ncbi:MAG TPA: RecX family transcriptional regulator, partial [Candidatus Binatia bacterium]|nr:RecX family transcriptional regulator [Candidatus Binatia bacterium]
VTITSIKQQIKNPERVSIFVDERYSFSLSLDELIKYKLKKELELTEGDVKKFKKLSEDGKLRARSLEWLLNRPHSTREFRDYLYKKKAEADLTDKLIEEFAQKGYLDDAKFAAWFIELRQRKNRSPRAIRAELMQKGISGELLNDAMSSDQINEREALKDLIAKKKNLSKYKNDPQKLKQYLASRGFGYDIINETLKDT